MAPAQLLVLDQAAGRTNSAIVWLTARRTGASSFERPAISSSTASAWASSLRASTYSRSPASVVVMPRERPDEQLSAGQRLERAHPLRERGLAHAQQPRGAAEAAEIDRGAERAQLGQVDGPDQCP